MLDTRANPDRSTFLGGSDVAAIFNIAPKNWNRTPLALWREKNGHSTWKENAQRDKAMARGKRLEPYILDMARDEWGLTIVHRNRRFIDDEFHFFACEVDAESVGEDDIDNVEAKNVSPYLLAEYGEDGTDGTPVYYTAQAMFNLGITHRRRCHVAALFGDDLRRYLIQRDHALIHSIRTTCAAWWQKHMIEGIEPEPTTTQDIIDFIIPDVTKTIEVYDNPDLRNLVSLTQHAIQARKTCEDREEVLKTRLQLAMRDATVITLNGKPLVTWKEQGSRGGAVTRVLRFPK